METLSDIPFLPGLIELIFIDVMLSGDNAVVIAMASRGLPAPLRRSAIVLGTVCAILLRVVFTVTIGLLLTLPYLKLIGGIVLMVISVRLIAPAREDDPAAPKGSRDLWQAIRIIVIADIAMSLDNVVAIAAVADGDTLLLTIGFLLSMPLLIVGSTLASRLLAAFPVLVWACGGLLGWVGGQILAEDPVLGGLSSDGMTGLDIVAPVIGAVTVLLAARLIHVMRAQDAREDGQARRPAEDGHAGAAPQLDAVGS